MQAVDGISMSNGEMDDSLVTYREFTHEMAQLRRDEEQSRKELWAAVRETNQANRDTAQIARDTAQNVQELTRQLKDDRAAVKLEKETRSNRLFMVALAIIAALVGVSLNELANGFRSLFGVVGV